MKIFWSFLTIISVDCMESHPIERETCFEKYCFTWNKNYGNRAEECQTPYWSLEIYDQTAFMEMSYFVASKNVSKGYLIPLGMTCETGVSSCLWNRYSEEVIFNKFQYDAKNINRRTVYFDVRRLDDWLVGDLSGDTVQICMKLKKLSSNYMSNEYEEKQTSSKVLVICVVLALACLALLMLLIALLLLLLRRKKTRSVRRLTIQQNGALIYQNSPHFGETFFDSPDYGNVPTISGNIIDDIRCEQRVTYAHLVWDETYEDSSNGDKCSKAQVRWSDHKRGDAYENSPPREVSAPGGCEYSLVNKEKAKRSQDRE